MPWWGVQTCWAAIVGTLLALAAGCAVSPPGTRAAFSAAVVAVAHPDLPVFGTVTLRTRVEPNRDVWLVIVPFLTEKLPPAYRTTSFTWELTPAFEPVFGLRQVAADAVVGAAGQREDLVPGTWHVQSLREEDGRQPLNYWRNHEQHADASVVLVRLPAERQPQADHLYRLRATLVVTGPGAAGPTTEHRLTYEEHVQALPTPSGETDWPADLHDPTGEASPEAATSILRGWLTRDDWYLQCVAVIRLKEFGARLAPVDLQRFFRLAALAGDRRLVCRALDALGTDEAREGMGRLLAADCAWVLPRAIRVRAPGTREWLEKGLHAWARGNTMPRVYTMVGHTSSDVYYELPDYYQALLGPAANDLLADLARRTTDPKRFTRVLGAVRRTDSALAMDLLNRRCRALDLAGAGGARLLAAREDGGIAAASVAALGLSGWDDAVRHADVVLPDEIAAFLAKLEPPAGQSYRGLLAYSRLPAANAACLAGLEKAEDYQDGFYHHPLLAARRTDLVPAATRLALAKYRAGAEVSHLIPLLLLDPPEEAYDLLVNEYLSGRRPLSMTDDTTFPDIGRDPLIAFLRSHPERTAQAVLAACRTGDYGAREAATDWLWRAGDPRAARLILERLRNCTPPPVRAGSNSAAKPGPNRGGFDTGGTSDEPPSWDHKDFPLGELLYLAAFVPQEGLAIVAPYLVALQSEAYGDRTLDMGLEFVNRHEVVWANRSHPAESQELARIAAYFAAIGQYLRDNPCSNGCGPSLSPSPENVLSLRAFPVAAIVPLVEPPANQGHARGGFVDQPICADVRVRVLGARLLGRRPAEPQARALLLRLLEDPAEEVRAAALTALAEKPWERPDLWRSKPGGPLRAAIAEALAPWPTDEPVQAWRRRGLALLAEGDPAMLPLLDHADRREMDAIAQVLAAPGAQDRSLQDQIVGRLYQSQWGGKEVLGELLGRPLPLRARLRIARRVGADTHAALHGAGRGQPLPVVKELILAGLAGERDVCLQALDLLSYMRVPESIPRLIALLDTSKEYGAYEVMAAMAAQGQDDRLGAALDQWLRARKTTGGVNLRLCTTVLGDRALPLLREFEAAARGDPQQASWYGEVIAVLLHLQDQTTLEQQADWLLAPGVRPIAWQEPPLSRSLCQIIAPRLVKFPPRYLGRDAAAWAGKLARQDPALGVPLLLTLLRGTDGEAAIAADCELARLADAEQRSYSDVRPPTAERIRQAERWWQLEHGRSAEVLATEALLP